MQKLYVHCSSEINSRGRVKQRHKYLTEIKGEREKERDCQIQKERERHTERDIHRETYIERKRERERNFCYC